MTIWSTLNLWLPTGIPAKLRPLIDGPKDGVRWGTVGSTKGGRTAADRGSFLFLVFAHLLFIKFVADHCIFLAAIGAKRVNWRWEVLDDLKFDISSLEFNKKCKLLFWVLKTVRFAANEGNFWQLKGNHMGGLEWHTTCRCWAEAEATKADDVKPDPRLSLCRSFWPVLWSTNFNPFLFSLIFYMEIISLPPD